MKFLPRGSSLQRLASLLVLFATPLVASGAPAADPAAAGRNVILVTLDGLRWQEVFRGPEEAMINVEFGGIAANAVNKVRESVRGPDPESRRQHLMPFLWGHLIPQGQIFGNRDQGSHLRVANAEWFSYPGYTEILCGFPDPLVTSNTPIPNRNVTVLEWLNGRSSLTGRVAAAATWHVFPAIINVGRSRLPVWVSTQNPSLAARSPRFAEIDRWMRDVPLKANDEHYDAFGFHAALTMIDELRPRVLYIALGEADTNAHRRRYDAYLESITRSDRFLRELWEKLQSLEQYRDNTTLIITTDHGRGRQPQDWINHNKKTPGADETWLAIIGPDIPARGPRANHPALISAQVAATMAAAVGEDYKAAEPRAAPALPLR
jgi:hypothetical protein